MRVFGLLIIALLLVGFSGSYFNEGYLLLDHQQFSVKGSTSIGAFDCHYDFSSGDTLFFHKSEGLKQRIPVKEFKCGNFVLNHDFRKTLKHKEFPEVEFQLQNVRPGDQALTYDLHLKIAGKEKVIRNSKLVYHSRQLEGEVQLKFGDFDLVPPKKMGGAIQVHDDIELFIQFKTHR